MEVHSFTTEDAAKQTDKALFKLTDFDPIYDKENMSQGVLEMNNAANREIFDKDMNRQAILLIETPNGIKNLSESCKEANNGKISYDGIHKILRQDYKLSREQTEYILAAASQGSIAGGSTGVNEVLATKVLDPVSMISRTKVMSKIVIDDKGNLSYSSGQKTSFDCSQASAEGELMKNPIAHSDFASQDYLTRMISAKLGHVGEEVIKPQVTIDVSGAGKIGSAIVKDLQNIKSSIKTLSKGEVEKNYTAFVEHMLEKTDSSKEYNNIIKQNIKNILSEKDSDINKESLKKFEITKNILADLVFDKIDERLNELKEKNLKIASKDIKIISEEAASSLEKFTGAKTSGYLKRFTTDLVTQRAEANDVIIPKKNFIQKIVSHIKDLWHGYDAKSSSAKQSTKTEQLKLEVDKVIDKKKLREFCKVLELKSPQSKDKNKLQKAGRD